MPSKYLVFVWEKNASVFSICLLFVFKLSSFYNIHFIAACVIFSHKRLSLDDLLLLSIALFWSKLLNFYHSGFLSYLFKIKLHITSIVLYLIFLSYFLIFYLLFSSNSACLSSRFTTNNILTWNSFEYHCWKRAKKENKHWFTCFVEKCKWSKNQLNLWNFFIRTKTILLI